MFVWRTPIVRFLGCIILGSSVLHAAAPPLANLPFDADKAKTLQVDGAKAHGVPADFAISIYISSSSPSRRHPAT